jgi:DNA-binding IclR family transcriptional regulator
LARTDDHGLESDLKDKIASARGIQSIETGGRILRALVASGRPMTLSEIAQYVGLPTGQTHAYLVSFRKIDLIEKESRSNTYRLGPFAAHLGLLKLRQTNPLHLATEAVDDLARELEMMIALVVWGSHGPTAVRVQEVTNVLHVNLRVGSVFSISGTATGYIFGAFLPSPITKPFVDAEICASSARSSVTVEARKRHYRKIQECVRQSGYGYTVDAPIPGISAISAPVFDADGQLQVAVTVAGPSLRLDCSESSPQLKSLKTFTANIMYQLGVEIDAPVSANATIATPSIIG